MRRLRVRTISRYSFFFAMVAVVPACTGPAKGVFMRQNQAAAALATMAHEAEAQNSINLEMIYAVEALLDNACTPIRDVASRHMNREAISIGSEVLAMVTLDRCATELDQVEKLIWREAPTVAQIYLGPAPAPRQEK